MGQGEGKSNQESLAGWLVGQVAEERGRYLKNEGSLPSKQERNREVDMREDEEVFM